MLAGCQGELLEMSEKTATGPLKVMRNTVRAENHTEYVNALGLASRAGASCNCAGACPPGGLRLNRRYAS